MALVLLALLGRLALASFYAYAWDLTLVGNSEGARIDDERASDGTAWRATASASNTGPRGYLATSVIATSYDVVMLEWASE